MRQGITPGPWTARPLSGLNDGTQDKITGLGWSITGPPEPQLRGQFSRAADAYLVAAAPELLEALEELLEWELSMAGLGHPRLDKARAAIAKARHHE